MYNVMYVAMTLTLTKIISWNLDLTTCSSTGQDGWILSAYLSNSDSYIFIHSGFFARRGKLLCVR